MNGLVPDQFRVQVDGNSQMPVPVKITLGDKAMIVGIALALALALRAVK